MKRKIYNALLEWKNKSSGHTAIMLDGARRVGKSYIAEEFARNEYEKSLTINFSEVSPTIKEYFFKYLGDLDTFFMYLFAELHVSLPKRRSLIIFDEVQNFPRAREAIKRLVADGRYDYLETGSLISLHRNVKDILIPSEERHLKMYPMDFEEFLWALGNETAMDLVRKSFAERRPLDQAMHAHLMSLLRQYMVVGGMPQAVEEFRKTKDLPEVDAIKQDILDVYNQDIHMFGDNLRHKAASLFRSIPAQLSRHEKRFVMAEISKNARMRDYEEAFEWLSEAMTVNMAHGVSEPNLGFCFNEEKKALKCYLGDTGLLVSMAFASSKYNRAEIHHRILMDNLSINQGMLTENLVAQMLKAAGHDLYFYSSRDTGNSQNTMEIDFLISQPALLSKRNVIPLEVKSGHNLAHSSLDKFRAKYRGMIAESFLLSDRNVMQKNGITCLPLYMAPLIVSGI